MTAVRMPVGMRLGTKCVDAERWSVGGNIGLPNGAATMVRLFPNGKINDAAGPASWELQGDTLVLLWPNAAAPGGVWRDTLQVSPDRARYAGQNQNGTPIHGWQVASE